MSAYQQDTLHTLLTLTWSCQRHVGPFLYWCTDWLNFIINRLLQLRQIISMDVLLPYVHTHQKLLCFPSVVKQQINKIYNKALPWRCWLGGRWVSSFLTAHQHIIGHFSAMGGRKGIRPVKKLSGGVLAWLSVWREVQTCIWPSWCHCHSLSLASVKSRSVLTFWCQLTRVVRDKGPLNGCVYV